MNNKNEGDSNGEVELKIVADYGTDRIDASVLNTSNYISTDNLLPERGGITNSDYLPTKGKVSKFNIGDTLVSNIRPYFKKIWYAKEIGGCSNDVIVFKPKTNKIDPKYLYYQLSKDDFFDFMMSGANGTKMPRGNKKSIPTFRLLLPPLPTQKRIASILSAYDDLIENNLKRIKLLEEVAQRTYEEWFVKFTINGEQLTIDEKTGLPVGWERKSLPDFANILFGYPFKANDFNSEKKGTPIIRIRNIPISDTNDYTTQEVDKKYIINKGDLLVGMDGEFHINNWYGTKAYLVQRSCKIEAKNKLFQGYLTQAIVAPVKFYEATISGATVAHLGKKHLDEIQITVPTYQFKKELENLNSLIEQKVNLAHQNRLLKESRDILLPKLMNGTLNVES